MSSSKQSRTHLILKSKQMTRYISAHVNSATHRATSATITTIDTTSQDLTSSSPIQMNSANSQSTTVQNKLELLSASNKANRLHKTSSMNTDLTWQKRLFANGLWKATTAYMVGTFALIQFASVSFTYFDLEASIGFTNTELMKILYGVLAL